MKNYILISLLSIGMAILDRTYYEALGTIELIENFPSVLRPNKSDNLSEDFQKYIIQIEIQRQKTNSKKLTLVLLL